MRNNEYNVNQQQPQYSVRQEGEEEEEEEEYPRDEGMVLLLVGC